MTAVAHAMAAEAPELSRRRKKMLVADLLCGAGGSSTGCEQALRELGLEMELVCLNHWPTAIETHKKNHPHARHYCQDIATVRPHLVVPEGYLDLLMASPSCTHHSVARGGKPTSDQQRSDPWHIITWLTELRVRRIIIENVWEYIKWGPVDPRTGRPIKGREGEYFHAWINVIKSLGFDPYWYKQNAADFGEATTRSRFIMMARNDRKQVLWPVHSHHKPSDQPNLLSTVAPWRAASEIIDWSRKGRSIFGRPIPLAPKTLARILAGAVKFGWPEPFIYRLLAEIERSLHFHLRRAYQRRHTGKKSKRGQRRQKARALVFRLRHFRLEPMSFAKGKGGRSVEPMLVTLRRNADGRRVSAPIPSLAAGGNHIGIAEPIILNRHSAPRGEARPVSKPVPTPTSSGAGYLVEPFVLATGSTGAPRSTKEPIPTATTGGAGTEDRPGCARPMLVEPFIATVAHGNDAAESSPDSRRAQSTKTPLGTIHAGGGKYGLVEGFILSQASGGAPRPVEQPMPTATTDGAHALITPYYGSGSGETCTSAKKSPLPSVTTKARFGMVMPVTHADGTNRARDPDVSPLPTLTTANRGGLALVDAYIAECDGIEGYDILFRMLEPPELAAAMGFSTEEIQYEFAGTKTEQIKQIGNAVSVRLMKAHVRSIMADAAAGQMVVR